MILLILDILTNVIVDLLVQKIKNQSKINIGLVFITKFVNILISSGTWSESNIICRLAKYIHHHYHPHHDLSAN